MGRLEGVYGQYITEILYTRRREPVINCLSSFIFHMLRAPPDRMFFVDARYIIVLPLQENSGEYFIWVVFSKQYLQYQQWSQFFRKGVLRLISLEDRLDRGSAVPLARDQAVESLRRGDRRDGGAGQRSFVCTRRSLP